MTARTRRLLRIGVALALASSVLGGWALYYHRYNSACFDRPRTAGCDRFIAAERFICDYDLPAVYLLGGCSMLGARFHFGIGVPKDLGRSIEFFRRACLSRFPFGRAGSCILTSNQYGSAFAEPHYVLGWSGHYQSSEHTSRWARDLAQVLAESEQLCADDFPGRTFSPDRQDLLRGFCNDLPQARLAIADARAQAPALLHRCESGNAHACHLAGIVLTFGLGVPRRFQEGKALLRRACGAGSWLACDDLGTNGKPPSVLLTLLEQAVVSSSAPPTSP